MCGESKVKVCSKRDAEKALETHKYFELLSVGDKAIFDKLYFIEKSLTENNLRQSKVNEFLNLNFYVIK